VDGGGGGGCKDGVYGAAIQCYCEKPQEAGAACPPRPPRPNPPPPPSPFCAKDPLNKDPTGAIKGRWFLANYPNRPPMGEAFDYKDYTFGPSAGGGGSSGVKVNCVETCGMVDAHYGSNTVATGARFACNMQGSWGCNTNTYAAGFEMFDGADVPPGQPGGENSHCMTMLFDVDGDMVGDIVTCEAPDKIRYLPGTRIDEVGYDGGSAGNYGRVTDDFLGPFPVSEMGFDFQTFFVTNCVQKDCTHNNMAECLKSCDDVECTSSAYGCDDWLPNLAIQCYCAGTGTCEPAPPPAPPPLVCDELAPNGARCGPDNGGAMCRYCCASTGYCGDGALWCGGDAIRGASYKLIDPERLSCPWKPDIVEFEQYCTVNPATNNQHCVRIPKGKDFTDAGVQRGLKHMFAQYANATHAAAAS